MKKASKAVHSQYNAKVAWLALVGGIMIYFVNSAAQYKVPPILIQLEDALGLTTLQSGELMSIMALLGLILALPAGPIIKKLGAKWSTVLAASVQLFGALLGTFANGFVLMMISRAIEGAALGLCNVTAYAVVTAFFPPEKRGFPNAIITASFTVAVFMMMNVSVPLESSFNWQGVWWFVDILSIIAVLCALFLIPKKSKEIDWGEEDADAPKEKLNMKRLLTNRSVWFLPLCFVLFNIGAFGIGTYMPTYLVEDANIQQEIANFAVSLNSLVGIPASVVVGIILDKVSINKRKYVAAIAMLVLAACYFFAFRVTGIGTAVGLLVFMGFVVVFVPISLMTIGPDAIASSSYTPIVLAIVIFGQNLGMTLGPVVCGAIVESAGAYGACSVPIAVAALIGALVMVLCKNEEPEAAKAELAE